MADSFHSITQSLRRDSGISTALASVIGLALFIGWGVWACYAQIRQFESSESARLEITSSSYPIQANKTAELKESHLVLGRQVQAGDILVELDSSAEELSLEEERAHLASIAPQIAALDAQMESEQAGQTDERNVLVVARAGAWAETRQIDAEAMLAESEARRAGALYAEGVLSRAEADRAESAAKSKRAAADSLKLTASRLEPELRVRERGRQVRLQQDVEQRAKLQAERSTAQATVRKLAYEVARRCLRASISGRIAECARLQPGSHISEGQQLGVILPEGRLAIVAEFSPSAALGRIRPHQNATLRLAAFPWTQYGTVAARVAQVANEPRDGKVRVELTVISAPPSLALQHDAPGTVEVETGVTSPAALLFRSAGALVGAP